MSTLTKIKPEEFYASFIRLFHERLRNQLEHLDERYQETEAWTQFMLEDFLPQVIKDVSKGKGHPEGRLEYRHEKLMRVDLCAYDVISDLWQGDNVNQAHHNLPLYVHLMIEHENGQWPNQEFWKLLHLCAPLKVLVCYLFPRGTSRSYQGIDSMLGWFKQMHDRALAFHPRSADDAYLLIIGRRGAEKPSELDWQGYQIETGQQDFARTNLT